MSITTLRSDVARLSFGPQASARFQSVFGVAQGVGVDEHLVAVVAKPLAVKVGRPIDPVGIMRAGPETLDVHVPEEERLVDGRVQRHNLDRLPIVVRVEEQQFDRRGIPRENGEVHAVLVGDGAKRMGMAWGGFILDFVHRGALAAGVR